MPWSRRDRELMLRAVAVAERGRWTAHPNPLVGAVVTDDRGAVVGEGHHRGKGHPHAEQEALEVAGERARGGTLYVTLEPCNHAHRTPPCTGLVLESGVRRVVAALEDPDERVRGAGFRRLEDSGLEVVRDVEAAEAADQNRDYIHHRRTGLPYVVLKAAVSIEGVGAAPDGTSQWITGEAARLDAHRLRAEADAVMVGSGTFLRDEPALTCRLPGYTGRQPLRVVMDRRGRIGDPPGWAVARGGPKDTLVDLGARGIVRLLVEGGPTLVAAFSAEGLVDEYVSYVAPLSLAGAPTLEAGRRLRLRDVTTLAGDVRLRWEAEH